ncbi:isopentenyl phosphate kinase [Promethearchaeum syntrophicum]|uniref:Isopentenyl phosphate kinase n=1 Tax=Promethearchaeum syntrophicum TaxID=2594042 RepID=A0A5B9D8Q6_9ARCH|nr:isopentenyl phosphate kinase [Candidatus Prometheoarchaeum syntrophicum]QEE15385.1 Isopentenyl phosphate kinase [Candidatus Prometheoarchaeum syntrophicum]
MVNKNPVIIVKLGGSILTDKNIPNSIKEKEIKSLISQISDNYHISTQPKIIIIHGAGSFGHPLANSFSIQNGLNQNIPNQILGLAKTHQSVRKLNNKIINSFLGKNIPVLSLTTSSIFYQEGTNLKFTGFNHIESLLDIGIIPILFGDILIHDSNNFSILSGDRVIYEICNSFSSSNNTKYRIDKIIFCFDKDGLIISNGEEDSSVIPIIKLKDIDLLQLKTFEDSIDVTGNIRGKLHEIKKICKLGIPVQLINGQKPNLLIKALKNEKILSTLIK